MTAAASSGPDHRAWPADATRLRVDDVAIDLRYRRVETPDGATELPNRMFDLLLVFLARPHVLHTRAALFEQVWRGTVVEDANLSQSVWMLRKALGPRRRHWIRTVPGSGYVFEPPVPVQAGDAGSDVPGGDGTRTAPGDEASRTRRPAPGRRWLAATAAFLLLASATFGMAAWQKGRSPGASAAQPVLAVALLEVGTEQRADRDWPATLLHAWLGWKLRQLPDAVVLGEPDLAGDAGAPDPVVVLLASGPAGDGSGEMFVRARLAHGAGAPATPMELRGPPAQMPAMVDRLSDMVVQALLPDRSGAGWPAIGVDADGGRAYAAVAAARHARDWPSVVDGAHQLLQAHPGFGLVRLDLAQAQARLGEAAMAQEQMALARRLLTPLPDDAAQLMDARELALSQHKATQAAAAYAGLARAYPQQGRFALEHARHLLRAGNPRGALEILETSAGDPGSLETRVRRLLTVSRALTLLGDAEAGRASAREAARMAQLAGRGWELELGEALMLMARSDLMRLDDDAALVMLEQSARQFDLAGTAIQAQTMRFLAELVRSPAAADRPMLGTLLREARRRGDRDTELELLHAVAHRHYRAGQHGRYRDRLDQAAAIANEAGSPFWRLQVELDLLNEDILLGDLHSARKRIGRLQATPPQGDGAARLAIFDAFLLEQQGLTGDALAALDQAAGASSSMLPAMSMARLACGRARLSLQQGRLVEARDALAPCGSTGHPLLRLEAGLLETRLMQLSGRPRAAAGRLSSLRADLDRSDASDPDGLWLRIDLADLYNRAGMPAQGRQALDGVRRAAETAGHGWLLALAETGLAESAASQGDWDTAAGHLATARRLVPDDTWPLARRLDLVAAVLALAHGSRDDAIGHLSRLDAKSHRLGDVPAILEVHSLVPAGAHLHGCPDRGGADHPRGGLGGANLAWLAAALPDDAEGVAPAALARR